MPQTNKTIFLWIVAASCLLTTLTIIIRDINRTPVSIDVYNVSSEPRITCGYTKLYPGGYGSQVHDMMFAWSWALQHNVIYKGVEGSFDQNLIDLIRLLKLPFQLQVRPFEDCILLSNYKSDRWVHMNNFFKRPNYNRNVKTNRTIVVHIRRGDVNMDYEQTGDYYRYIPNSYFLNLLEKIRRPNDHVIIFSQKTESFEEFVNEGYDVKLDTSVVQAWKTIIESDVFIMSRSSFSYVPALFAHGAVYYNEFWCKPLSHWLVNTTFDFQINRVNKTPMKETILPCKGGEFGADTIQSYACIISKQIVKIEHMPHWAQVVYPCWSWFAEKRAKNCIFLVKDGLSSGWFSFMAERMGCLVIHKQPKMCTVLGLLDKRISVDPGETYSWLSSPLDAAKLQYNTFRQGFVNRGIGIIRRKHDRHISNIEKMNITKELVYFEHISYLNQARWMYEHDIIISAHGAAITHSIFVQKCTAVIQLYPEHYYPNKFFEPLIIESGGIPITWIKNKYIGNNATLAAANDAMLDEDFKKEHLSRGKWKLKDIDVDIKTLNSLIQLAKEKQQKCRNQTDV